ncbi:DUF6286 domain-containing Asp23/Gls24 family envelope stress response protein [Rhodococcus tukisamuensis]|uniref:Uncharacterized conserved protein YloU, alkaline shock protein (Asp23) family n=1 Tax=Rhodococcus tukisamuensis TaxID=168276 RepID=A0A1G6ZQK4_9NOCA|nr:DUF6286 domain-containing Asp23/Gls24 family envelope stress response protein [Rhodococcus tukisamuensis]SDE04517.1 Uncharacterized conserved protein YloU, alkaline shock protein (Asp23) family [Rhodococcus tukisamuensis]
MADAPNAGDAALDAATGHQPDEPSALDRERGARGRLIVKDKAIAKIAVAAALQVPGVVRHSGGLFLLGGRDLPRAEVAMGADSVAVALYVAVTWPCPVAVLSREVHRQVGEQIRTLGGIPMESLHIVVAAAVPGGPQSPAEVDARQLVADGHVDALPPAARPPVSRPAAAFVTLLVAALLLALAGLTGREFLIAQEVIAPAAWLRNSATWLAGLHWQGWMLPAGVAAAVCGLVLVYLALAPTARTHLALGRPDLPVVWLRPTDVARMCSAHAGTVAGVHSVHTTVDRRRATVHVVPNGDVDDASLQADVRDAVAPRLATLTATPELRVRIGRVRP